MGASKLLQIRHARGDAVYNPLIRLISPESQGFGPAIVWRCNTAKVGHIRRRMPPETSLDG
jgi:hypothetical protein